MKGMQGRGKSLIAQYQNACIPHLKPRMQGLQGMQSSFLRE